MAKTENELDNYYAVVNTNTSRQKIEIGGIIKKRNSLVWTLVSTSTAIVDTDKQFSKLYLFCEKVYDEKEGEFQFDSGYDSFAT